MLYLIKKVNESAKKYKILIDKSSANKFRSALESSGDGFFNYEMYNEGNKVLFIIHLLRHPEDLINVFQALKSINFNGVTSTKDLEKFKVK